MKLLIRPEIIIREPEVSCVKHVHDHSHGWVQSNYQKPECNPSCNMANRFSFHMVSLGSRCVESGADRNRNALNPPKKKDICNTYNIVRGEIGEKTHCSIETLHCHTCTFPTPGLVYAVSPLKSNLPLKYYHQTLARTLCFNTPKPLGNSILHKARCRQLCQLKKRRKKCYHFNIWGDVYTCKNLEGKWKGKNEFSVVHLSRMI